MLAAGAHLARQNASSKQSSADGAVDGRVNINGSSSRPTAVSSARLAYQATISSPTEQIPPRSGRRGSLLSNSSLEDARDMFRSSTDSLLLPKPSGLKADTQHETSHWHSAPLAFALLPAIAGMVFSNGSAVVTDVTLLALAAVFLNWSVRLPWDWYRSAQTIDVKDVPQADLSGDEDSNSTAGPDADTSKPHSTGLDGQGRKQNKNSDSAITELRVHELFALLSCFLMPLLGAFLLHTIRSQLSRPSEGLVSNYNLTIFLLVSELRPTAHLVRMIQARTLHLQRTVNTNPYTQPDRSEVVRLAKRLNDLEARSAANGSMEASHADVANVSSEVRRALQPDLDALNRAVRRYEKKATLQTMQTESRLLNLESRLNDALALAAAAAQSSQQRPQERGAGLMQWAYTAVTLPLQAMFAIFSLPSKASSIVLAVGRVLLSLSSHEKRSRNGSTRTRTSVRGKERSQAKAMRRIPEE